MIDKSKQFFKNHCIDMLRIALAIVFIWFGALKLFGISPANVLIEQTVFWFNPTWFIPILGLWEVIIGIFFLVPKLTKYVLWIMLPQMMGTFLPLIVLSAQAFQGNLLAPTMEGQYIIKNLVLITGAMVVVLYTHTTVDATTSQAGLASRAKRASAKARKRR
jgi:uncharacterized membrane protein YphA (DoxX/SURF4 family)